MLREPTIEKLHAMRLRVMASSMDRAGQVARHDLAALRRAPRAARQRRDAGARQRAPHQEPARRQAAHRGCVHGGHRQHEQRVRSKSAVVRTARNVHDGSPVARKRSIITGATGHGESRTSRCALAHQACRKRLCARCIDACRVYFEELATCARRRHVSRGCSRRHREDRCPGARRLRNRSSPMRAVVTSSKSLEDR